LVRKFETSQFEIKKKYSNKIDSVEMPNDEHQVGFKINHLFPLGVALLSLRLALSNQRALFKHHFETVIKCMLEKESQNHEFLVIVDELLDSINSGDIIANKVGVTHCKVNSDKTFFDLQEVRKLSCKRVVGKLEKLERSTCSWKVSIEVGQDTWQLERLIIFFKCDSIFQLQWFFPT